MGTGYPSSSISHQEHFIQKRVLLYVHDGTGFGHLRRIARIAQKLQGPFSCLIITGYGAAHWLVPEGSEYIRLPNWESILPNAAAYWGRKPFISMDASEFMSFRLHVINGIIKGYNPDAIVVDYLPMGKKGELAGIIKNSRAKKYCVIRGILNQNDTYKDRDFILNGQSREYLEKYYDRLFIACDEKVFNFSKEYNITGALLNKTVNIGYITEQFLPDFLTKIRAERGLSPDSTWVVCSAGGGQLGEKLISQCLSLSKNIKDVYFDIILGPRSNLPWDHAKLSIDIEHVRVHKECHSLHYLHASADIVICSGGYNSLMEALQGNASIICCPVRFDCQDEQYLHPTALAKFANIQVTTELSDIHSLLENSLRTKRTRSNLDKRTTLNFMGVNHLEKIIKSDFGM